MGSENQLRVGLNLAPLDTLFFRDGRPFEAATQATSGMPQPQTVAGALRTWLLRKAGCDFEKLGEAMASGKGFEAAVAENQPDQAVAAGQVRFRGPWFAVRGEPVVDVPCILHKVEETGEIVRLAPLEKVPLPGWAPAEEGMLPLWTQEARRTKRLGGYLRLAGLRAFLNGGLPDRREVMEADDLFDQDRRTGIVVNSESLSVEEGMIYAISLLALKPGVSLYAEAIGPRQATDLLPAEPAPLPLGGEGRYVALQKSAAFDWPSARPQGNQGRMLVLTAPAFFSGGWRPANLQLVSAAVPGHVAVSGWDLARKGPKPSRFAAAAGSVYFINQVLEPLPDSLCETEDAALGWGTFVEGVWNHV
jgi:CRISPR-associated protein Cmr3